jgi:hypothetical protein
MDTRVESTIGYEHVQVSAAAGIATIAMNRPERRNALSEAHMRELIAALRAAGDQPDVRAVILAANGSVFCSGHDFADMIERDLDGMRRLLTTCTELMLTIRRLPQPVVAKVQGLATAAGCQLVASLRPRSRGRRGELRHSRRQGRVVLPHAERRRGTSLERSRGGCQARARERAPRSEARARAPGQPR